MTTFIPSINGPYAVADAAELAALESGAAPATALSFPNVTFTDEANPVVNVFQIGVDAAGVLKEQHLTTADQTDVGSGANLTINPGSAKGVDQAGAVLRLSGGISTGAGTSSSITFMHSAAGGAGSTDRTPQDKWYMTDVVGFSVFYPATDNVGFLGLSSNRLSMAYLYGIEVSGPGSPGHLYLRSPNGARWDVQVSNAGALSTVSA